MYCLYFRKLAPFSLCLLTNFYFSPCCGMGFERADYQSSATSRKLNADRLSTTDEHTQFLLDSLVQAEKHVMVSSFNLDPDWLKRAGIESAILQAAKRGVKIYIYFKYLSGGSEKQLWRLEQACYRFAGNDNHAKCVIRDNEVVAVGSHDWLAKPYTNSHNATWVLTGSLSRDISDEIWRGIRLYQSFACDNEGGIHNFMSEEDSLSLAKAKISNGQSVFMMGTPEAHDQFFTDQVVGKATTQISICSPFIRFDRVKNVLSEQLIRDLQRKRVCMSLMTLPNPCNRTEHEKEPIFSYLGYLDRRYANFTFTVVPNLHAKTICVDDTLLCEGSFNWLSAVDETFHDANNNEMSIGLKGFPALKGIQNFRQSLLEQSFPEIGVSQSFPKRRSEEPTVGSKKYKPETTFPQSFLRKVETFSGAKFGKRGFCARLEGEYICDEREKTLYFPTENEAVEAAFEVWHEEHSLSQTHTRVPQVPHHFKTQLQIYPGFNGEGFCVRLKGGEYLRERKQILYYPTREAAEIAAFEAWG